MSAAASSSRSIAGVSDLVEVQGDVLVKGNQSLAFLVGFSALERIGGTFEVNDNDSLQSVAGFTALRSVGDLYFIGNAALLDFVGQVRREGS